jgi:serine protease AprX
MGAVRGRGLLGGLSTGILVLACAQGAAARAPLAQLQKLEAGTAIVQYDARTTSAAKLRRIGSAAGVSRTYRFRVLPFVGARGSAAELRRLASARGVTAVHMTPRLRYFLHESVPLAFGGTDPAPTWNAGFDGRGVNVAIVDSGVDGLHPDLQKRVVANFKMVGSEAVQCPNPCNTDITGGHGTHVAGIVAGDGTASGGYYRGMAPGGGIVGFSTGEGVAVLFALEAFDYILANNSKLHIAVVNNSWGPANAPDQRFDATDPVNVATKALHDAGVTVVFAAGNDGTGPRTDPGHEGGSDCAPKSTGECRINMYSVAPWTIGVGNTRKDRGPKPGDQSLNYSSSRGDPFPQVSFDGSLTIDYVPTVSAPGTNIVAARDQGGTIHAEACGSADAPACIPPAGHPEWALRYMPLTGTSMAAPHVAGAIAVLQSYAAGKLGRALTPDEVKQILASSAAPMTKPDMLWDWPCGSAPIFVSCGTRKLADMTGTPYQRWQVGAGALDVTAAMAKVDALVPPPPPPAAAAAPAGRAVTPADTIAERPAATAPAQQQVAGTKTASPGRKAAKRAKRLRRCSSSKRRAKPAKKRGCRRVRRNSVRR